MKCIIPLIASSIFGACQTSSKIFFFPFPFKQRFFYLISQKKEKEKEKVLIKDMSETWSWLIKNISALLRALTLFSPFIFLDLISYSLLLIGMWVAHIWPDMIYIFFYLFINYRKKILHINFIIICWPQKREKLNKKVYY